MTVPMWYIRNTIQKYGARPPKRPNVLWPEPVTLRQAGFVPTHRMLGPHQQNVGFEATGNLKDHQYQFFIGKPWPQSQLAVCRCCRKSFYTIDEREKHFKTRQPNYDKGAFDPSCAVKIVCAMHLLQKDDVCVVCEKRNCTQRKWGFPLCSKPCIESWMFAERYYRSFQDALRLAQVQGWR